MAIDDKEFAFLDWLLGWKPELCILERVWGTDSCSCGEEWGEIHDIPPPDLTSDALYKAIIEGLAERDYSILYSKLGWIVHKYGESDPGRHNTLLDAARAAYQREMEQK